MSEAYYQFVMTEMIPVAHEMGLYIFRAFHTIPGPETSDQPMRQVEYIAEDLETIRASAVTAKPGRTLESPLGAVRDQLSAQGGASSGRDFRCRIPRLRTNESTQQPRAGLITPAPGSTRIVTP